MTRGARFRTMGVALGLTVVGYGLICAVMYLMQRRLVFPAPSSRRPVTCRCEVVEVPHGTPMMVRRVAGDGPWLVHFHGNRSEIGGASKLAELAAARGIGFVAIEYPGYAGAPGSPTEVTLLEAARADLRYLVDTLGVPRDRLVIEGHSLGTGVAVAMAAEGWGARLLLLSPYTSLLDVAIQRYPLLPNQWLLLDRFDSATRATNVKVPAMVVHGRRDSVIPWEQGQSLSRSLPYSLWVPVDDAGHDGLWELPVLRDSMFAFVESAVRAERALGE